MYLGTKKILLTDYMRANIEERRPGKKDIVRGCAYFMYGEQRCQCYHLKRKYV